MIILYSLRFWHIVSRKMKPPNIPTVHLFGAAAFVVVAAFALPFLSFGGNFAVWTGTVVFAAGVWLMMRTYRLMKRRGTTHQFGVTTRLIEDDVFRYSRNPMYVGMTAMLIGAALALRNLAALAAPLYFFIVLDRFFVPYEERKLEKEIGAPYFSYKAKVRRWF
jgi:protein-S-isoprenylcysteine O-methyltransferase Ste14